MQRARDEANFNRWMAAFNEAVKPIEQRADQLVDDEKSVEPPSISQRRSKKALSINIVKDDSMDDDFRRVSLNFFPGHGRKYPTFDDRLMDCRTMREINTETKSKQESGVKRRAKKNLTKQRPESASVSDFLLLNSPTMKAAPIPTPVPKRKLLHNPMIPTNKNVDKLVLQSGLNLTLSRWKKQTKKPAMDRPIRSMTSLHLAEEEYESFVNKATSDSKIDAVASPSDSRAVRAEDKENKTEEVEVKTDEHSKSDAKKKRRKSSLAKLKHFLFFARLSKKSDDEQSGKHLKTSEIEGRKRERRNSKSSQEVKQEITQHENNQIKDDKVNRKSWLLYEQQISEGNESVVEEPIEAKKAFECDANKEKEEGVIQRRRPSGDYAIEPRQRKYSLSQARETCHNRPATRSFDFENRTSRTLDRRSTVRALDFNFDLALDVTFTENRLALPLKTRVRALSPGCYDSPRALCRHCSLPISLILQDTENEDSPVPSVTVSASNEVVDSPVVRAKSDRLAGFADGQRLSFASAEVEHVVQETVDCFLEFFDDTI